MPGTIQRRRFGGGFAWCTTALAIALAAAITGCGGDDDSSVSSHRDAGGEDDGGDVTQPTFDANVPLPGQPHVDGSVEPGQKPPELADEACAVDTNKLYDLVTTSEPARPLKMGVDLIDSRFAVAFIDESAQCVDAVYMTELSGASGVGTPETTQVSDECTSVTDVAITHNGEHWLVAIIDARMSTYDLWVQPFDGESVGPAERITDNLAQESEVAIAPVGSAEDADEGVLVAFTVNDPATGTMSLMTRPLSLDGQPTGDAVELEPAGSWSFSGLSLARLGKFAGLAYRRFNQAGDSQIVLDVLAVDSGERDRDSWVLTKDAGPFGTVDLGTDGNGGGVMYSLGQADSRQLWFQQLDATGHAAPTMSGGLTGGPVDPVRIVGPPTQATDASLAKLPVGFAVSYRVLVGGQVQMPRIRAHFLDRFGRDIGKSDVALAETYGGRTAIESAYDGRIVLAWSNTTDEGDTTLTAAKLPCVGGL